jgi:hypothetical protein
MQNHPNIPAVRFFGIQTLLPQIGITLCSIFLTISPPILQFSRYKASQTTILIIKSASHHHYSQHINIIITILSIQTTFYCQLLFEKLRVNGLLSLPHTTRGSQILGKRNFLTPPPSKRSKSFSFSILKPFTILYTQAKQLIRNTIIPSCMQYNPYRILANDRKHQFNTIGSIFWQAIQTR